MKQGQDGLLHFTISLQNLNNELKAAVDQHVARNWLYNGIVFINNKVYYTVVDVPLKAILK